MADQRGFTVIELAVVAAFIIVLSMTAIMLYANFHARARIAQAQADAQTLASVTSMYISHVGSPPPSLAALTTPAVNPEGNSIGPFMATLPTPPAGWTAYAYTSSTAGTFSITVSGDSTTVVVP